MPRQKLSREELLSRVQEIVEYMNTHDGDLPAQYTQLGKALNNLRTNAKKDAFEQNYPGLIDEIHNISHKILMTSDRSHFFDRVRDMPTGGDFADQTNTNGSCILPTCPTLAMNLATGCFCTSHAYKNLLESDMFEHDEVMDQLLGYDLDGKFVVIDNTATDEDENVEMLLQLMKDGIITREDLPEGTIDKLLEKIGFGPEQE